ncbi:hypothetical protein ASC80_01590 [Afipia sp. Root123D2]|uniref:hypothetical protein n=1 Tax=Afipia sp. Root123D2 TaxID=1736436 RepID=UPI0006FAADC0|nr:hypothetical protein [Afipia sp. Root123D2]KQW22115.1 hypothetical protein ASC80_01590 [Afipia sp. Root123D2]
MAERYRPCRTGLHVCGADEDANEFFTLANYPARDQAEANAAFDRARKECEAGAGEPADFVVDLMCAGDISDDFHVTRQMLPRLAKAVHGVSTDA